MSRLSELIAELCPDGVEYKALGELGAFYGGLTGKSKKDFGDGAKFVTYNNVYGNPAVDLEEYGLVNVGPDERQNTVELSDVLFTISSENREEAGLTSVMTVDPGEPWYLNSFCTGWRLHDKSILLPDFLKHVLRGPEVREAISKTANGVTRFNISKPRLAKVRIPVPPIEVQREVVRILDEYTAAHDELVRQLEQEIELRKQSDALSYQRYLNEWIGATSETMMLKELVLPGRKISYGIVQPGEGGTGDLGVIRPIDIKNSHINVDGIKYVDRSKEDGYQRTKLQGGEILVVVRGTTGEIAVAPDECKGMNVTRGIAVIATNDSVVDRDYLFDFLRGESAQRYIANNTRGTALCQINISDLEKLKIPVLRDSLREGFAEARSKAQTMTDAHYGLIHELSTGISLENQLLSQIRNQLLSFPEKAA